MYSASPNQDASISLEQSKWLEHCNHIQGGGWKQVTNTSVQFDTSAIILLTRSYMISCICHMQISTVPIQFVGRLTTEERSSPRLGTRKLLVITTGSRGITSRINVIISVLSTQYFRHGIVPESSPFFTVASFHQCIESILVEVHRSNALLQYSE